MPRRILYIHGISEIGGAEKDLLNLLVHIDRQQWNPFVVCPPDGPFIKELVRIKIPVYPMNLPAWRKLKDLFRIPFAVGSLLKLIRVLKIDLVHVNDYWWGPMAVLASYLRRIPCVVHIRQEIEPRRVRQYWFKKAHRLIAISERIKSVAVGAGVYPFQISVIYSGIETSHSVDPSETKRIREQYHIFPNQPVIGTVANIFPRKGYEYLIEALVEIHKKLPDVHCLIVGEGAQDYYRMLLEKVRKEGLERVVTFTGFQKEVLAHIASMDVFVLPSVMEGFGIVLLEAMSMEKPIVATTVGGIPEIVEDQVTGCLVPPRNSNALAQKIIDLLENPSMREKLGRTARRRLLERFSINRTVSQLENLYGELVV